MEDDEWLHRFGEVLVYLSLSEGQDRPTRLVVSSEGKVDFSLCGRDRIIGQSDGLNGLYRRGYRVVLDKEGLTEGLPEADGRPFGHALPSAEEYQRVVSSFWFEAFHMPGYLARNELWVLKYRDWTMKCMLLRMLEWAALVGDPHADVGQIGKGMEAWAGPNTWRDLHRWFGRFDAESTREALEATVAIFRRAAREVAGALGFEYADEADRQITARIEHGRR